MATTDDRTGLLTAVEERELAARVARGDLAARDELVERNIGLIRAIAFQFLPRARRLGSAVDMDDLIQWGRLGLLAEVWRFDPDRAKFTIFAAQWLRNYLWRAVRDEAALVRVPQHLHSLSISLHLGTRKLGDPRVKKTTVALLAQAGPALRTATVGYASMDDELDPIMELAWPEPSEVETEIDRDVLPQLLATLPVREAEILRLRFGLVDGESQTHRKIGSMLGYTSEWVRKLERRALERLREAMIGSEA